MFGRISRFVAAAMLIAGTPFPTVVQPAHAAENTNPCQLSFARYRSTAKFKDPEGWLDRQVTDQLCLGAETTGPATCYWEVKSGKINWGGGTAWRKNNAVLLCQGAFTGTARLECFNSKIAGGIPFENALFDCRSSDQPQAQLQQQPQAVGYAVKPGELGPFNLASTQSGTLLSITRDALGQAWMIEPVDGKQPPEFVRLRSLTGDNVYLNIEKGPLDASSVEPGWWSAMWIMEKTNNGFRFKNRWKQDVYIQDPSGNPVGEFALNAAALGLAGPVEGNGPDVVSQAGDGQGVELRVQNYSGQPLDIFIAYETPNPEFIETIGPMQEYKASTLPGATWYLSQNDEWVTQMSISDEPNQYFAYGR